MIEFRSVISDDRLQMYKVAVVINESTFYLSEEYPKAVSESVAKRLTEESLSWLQDFNKLFNYTQGDYWSIAPHQLDFMLLKYDTKIIPKRCFKCGKETKCGVEEYDRKLEKFLPDKVQCPTCKYGVFDW